MDNQTLEELREAYFDLEKARQREAEVNEISESIIEGLSIVSHVTEIDTMNQKIFKLIQEKISCENSILLEMFTSGKKADLHCKRTYSQFSETPSEALLLSDFIKDKYIQGTVVNLFNFKSITGINDLFGSSNKGKTYQSALLLPIKSQYSNSLAIFVSSEKGFFSKFNTEYLTKMKLVLIQAQDKNHYLSNLVHSHKLASLGEMASGIAHEINNPLTTILGNINIISNIYKNNDEKSKELIPKCLDKCRDVVGRIAKLVLEMRTLSRETNVGDSEKVTFDAIVETAKKISSEKMNKSRIDFDVKIDCSLEGKYFYLNSIQISQILVNLIANSIDAIKDKSERWIKLNISQKNHVFFILITDSGNGIDNEHINKIFQPFYSTKDIGQGTGMGLSISRSIIQKMEGEIIYNNSSLNTQFIITIPTLDS